MTDAPFIEEVMQRANVTLQDRMEAVEKVARTRLTLKAVETEAKDELAEVKRRTDERIRDAERDHEKAYAAARSRGWTIEELRKVGLPQPPSRRRVRQRAARRGATSSKPGQDAPDTGGEQTQQRPEEDHSHV